jgi:hypothetical protein
MKGATENILRAAAVLVAALFMARALGIGAAVSAPARPAPFRYHGGKTGPARTVSPACLGGRCHLEAPHRGNVVESAFRNMHAGFIDCLGCHGKEAERRWKPSGKAGTGTLKVACDGPAAGGNPHDATGKPAECRFCHSEAGLERLSRRGIGGLPGNFASPVALRMMEEKGKRWVPEGFR